MDEPFQWREVIITRRAILEMGHLRQNKQKFWRRKSKIVSKINTQNWFIYRNNTTENCFTQPYKIEKNKVWDVLVSIDIVMAHMYVLQILLDQRTFYSHSQQGIYIKPQSECKNIWTTVRKLKICIRTYLHKKMKYPAGYLGIVLLNFCPMFWKGPESQ